MTPAFKITGGSGGDLTGTYSDRLIQITITDQSTEQSDSCSIELANRDGKLIIPEKGETLSIALGYSGNLRPMGQFVIDTVSIQGPPDTVTLSGKAAPFTAAQGFKPFQTRKTRSWDGVTLGNLVRKIAGEAGMTAAVSTEYDGWLLQHLDQTNESDMNLLTRLARDWKAVMKPMFGKLVFVKRGEAKSVTGQSVGGVTISRSECSKYSASLGQRTKFAKVRTKFHDVESGKSKRVTASDEDALVEDVDPDTEDNDGEDAVYEHPHDFADEQSASQGAKSILDQTQRGSESISVTLTGRPDIVAEGNVTLAGFVVARMNGAWCIKSVSHNFTKGGGFTTTVSGETPGGDAGKAKKAAKASSSGTSSGGGGAFVE
jgi:uncharacterized protein